MNYLILAKQQAHKAPRQNFYVTKTGIKRDYDLFGGKYLFKVYFNDGLYVEDADGKEIEKPRKSGTGKAKVSHKLQDSSDEKAD